MMRRLIITPILLATSAQTLVRSNLIANDQLYDVFKQGSHVDFIRHALGSDIDAS